MTERNKKVVVSGALGTLGSEITRAFALDGWSVIALDIKPVEKNEPASNIKYIQIDVSDFDDVQTLISDNSEMFEGLKCLVNCVGVAGPRDAIEDISPPELEQMFAVNVFSYFYLCKLLQPKLAKNGAGSIINIGSVAGSLGYAGRSAYAASKWAIVGLTKSLALELGSQGIRVNSVSPGAIEGPALQRSYAIRAKKNGTSIEIEKANLASQSALNLTIDPKKIASMVKFLASDQGAHTSGQDIHIDGATNALV